MKHLIAHRLPSFLFCAALIAGSQLSLAASPRTPVLLELFTSEGCSSCPPADRLLESFDKRQPIAAADLVVLSEHVDYWNHGGWTDPYSSSLFSQRQMEYAKRLGGDDIYTPQLVVDGSVGFVGSDEGQARAAIAKAAARNKLAVQLSGAVRDGRHVAAHLFVSALSAGETQGAAIYVAVADNEDRSQVAHGENAGRSLNHVAVVRTLVPLQELGQSDISKDFSIPVPPTASSGLRLVVFVQDRKSGRILGVAQTRL